MALAALAALMATGCTGDSARDAAGTTTPPASPSPEATGPTCVDVTVEEVALGLTVPAGFTVDLDPESRAAPPGAAHPVVIAESRSPGREIPGGLLLAYGFGPGDGAGSPRTVGDAVLDLLDRTGGTYDEPTTTSPTTIAGLPAEAGGREDERALDYNAPSEPPSQLRWWSLVVDDVQFVVALATATPEAESAGAGIPEGLRPGGCEAPPPAGDSPGTPTAT